MAITPSTQPSDGFDQEPGFSDPFRLPDREEILKQNKTISPVHRIGECEALVLNVPGIMFTPRGAMVDIHTVAISRTGIAAIHRGEIPPLDWIGLRIELSGATTSFGYEVNAVETEKIGLELYRSVFLFTKNGTS